jgi:hypothetical protein
MKVYARCLSIFLAFSPLTACSDTITVPQTWKAECIGRFQLRLPDNFETALSFELKKSQYAVDKEQTGNFFKNGDALTSSVFSVDESSLSISHIGEFNDYETYKRDYLGQRKDESIKKPGLYAATPVTGNEVKIELKNAFAWSSKSNLSVYLFRENRIFAAHVNKYKQNQSLVDARMGYFLDNFKERSQFNLPTTDGICIPFGFVKDDGSKYRNVGVAMRLIDHPDIEIFFKDTNASGLKENTAPEFKGSRGEVEFFWSYYGPSVGNQLQGTLNHYHDIKLGGYTGKYAFATIARSNQPNESRSKDGEAVADYKARVKKEIADGKRPLDYGFMASYKGDPSKTDEPDLMLYVIRTASRAIAAGKQPVSEEELKTMALQIAASIQRRKVD